MAESEEELKSFLIKMEEESEKVGLRLNIQKTEIMASGPVTSWQIDGDTIGMYRRWEGTIKQVKHQRIDAFQLWC